MPARSPKSTPTPPKSKPKSRKASQKTPAVEDKQPELTSAPAASSSSAPSPAPVASSSSAPSPSSSSASSSKKATTKKATPKKPTRKPKSTSSKAPAQAYKNPSVPQCRTPVKAFTSYDYDVWEGAQMLLALKTGCPIPKDIPSPASAPAVAPAARSPAKKQTPASKRNSRARPNTYTTQLQLPRPGPALPTVPEQKEEEDSSDEDDLDYFNIKEDSDVEDDLDFFGPVPDRMQLLCIAAWVQEVRQEQQQDEVLRSSPGSLQELEDPSNLNDQQTRTSPTPSIACSSTDATDGLHTPSPPGNHVLPDWPVLVDEDGFAKVLPSSEVAQDSRRPHASGRYEDRRVAVGVRQL